MDLLSALRGKNKQLGSLMCLLATLMQYVDHPRTPRKPGEKFLDNEWGDLIRHSGRRPSLADKKTSQRADLVVNLLKLIHVVMRTEQAMCLHESDQLVVVICCPQGGPRALPVPYPSVCLVLRCTGN